MILVLLCVGVASASTRPTGGIDALDVADSMKESCSLSFKRISAAFSLTVSRPGERVGSRDFGFCIEELVKDNPMDCVTLEPVTVSSFAPMAATGFSEG